MSGLTTLGQGGGGLPRYGRAPTADAVAAPYVRKIFEHISVFDNMSQSLSSAIAASTVTDADATTISAAVNNVLDDVGVLVQGQVEFPGGYYPINASLQVRSDSKLKAIGKATLKPVSGSTASPLLFNVANIERVEIEGFTFDGNKLGLTNFNNLVVGYQSEFIAFRRNTFTNTRGIALLWSTVARGITEENYFIDCGTYNRESGRTFSDARQAFATLGGGDGNICRHNWFQATGLDPISWTGEDGGLIEGNHIRDGDTSSIYVAETSNTKIIGNDISNYEPGTPRNTAGSAVDAIDNVGLSIVGNTCIGNGAGGIMIAGDSSDISITGNICKNNYKAGNSLHRGGVTFNLTSGKTITNCTVEGNVCRDDQGVGSVTQRFGIGVNDAGGSFKNLRISSDNILVGYDGSGNIDDTQVFQTTSVPAVAFPRVLNIADAATFTIGPDTTRGQVSVVQVNNGYVAAFSLQNGGSPIEVYDPSAKWVNTDTGTDQALYRDAGDNTIKLKNKTGGTKAYIIRMDFQNVRA